MHFKQHAEKESPLQEPTEGSKEQIAVKRRYISDEGYAVLMAAIGIGIILAVFVFSIDDSAGMITNVGFLFISLGGWLMSIVKDRKRRGLDVPPENRDNTSLSKPRGVFNDVV